MLLPFLVLAIAAGCHKDGRPSAPSVFGPDEGQPGETLLFQTVARDPQGGNLSYRFDWGDGTTPVWTPELGSGDTFRMAHVYLDTGEYAVAVNCRNEARLESDWSTPLQFSVTFLGPVTPASPLGPTQGFMDSVLDFFCVAWHVRGESVAAQFDWGDTFGNWTGYTASGATIKDGHRYHDIGEFAVRVHTRDQAGNVSPWSSATAVSIGLPPLHPPQNLRISTIGGMQVKIGWDAGGNEDSVRYALWFRPLNDTGFFEVAEVAGRHANHEPLGATGRYTVSARRNSEEIFAAETLSTIPVFSDTVVVYELNADSVSGYGWDSLSGANRLGSMLDTADAGLIDWYFTDLSPGYAGPGYYLASAQFGQEDPGGVVPPGPWRPTRLTVVMGDIQDPLPEYDSLYYQRVVDASSPQTNVAVYTAEGHYALVSAYDPNRGDGFVRVLSWFQTIPGLRLIQHPKPSPE